MLFKKKPISAEYSVYGYSLQVVANKGKIPKARMLCTIESDDTILIGDISHYYKDRDFCKGYGTLMMQKLISFAKENGYKTIYGHLSTVDLDHKDRLYHFYKKFGFEITENEEQDSILYGKITLNL